MQAVEARLVSEQSNFIKNIKNLIYRFYLQVELVQIQIKIWINAKRGKTYFNPFHVSPENESWLEENGYIVSYETVYDGQDLYGYWLVRW